MLELNLYIHSCGNISPRATSDGVYTHLLAQEPDYTGYIQPMQLRRMSKAVRMGIGASHICLEKTNLTPDALSIGTAMGCLQDTELFLNKMVVQDEKMLTPTAFIQSTHNTVGGQIALLNKCYGHNMTYVHRGHSFEHAMVNAKLYLHYHKGQTVLTGAIDEVTEHYLALSQIGGCNTQNPVSTLPLYNNNIAGEGATFFMVNEIAENALLKIKKIHLFTAENADAALEKLNKSPLVMQPDLLLLGASGNAASKDFYEGLQTSFSNTPTAIFKHLSGDYPTASAYGLHCITEAVLGDYEPLYFISTTTPSDNIKQALFINNYGEYYAVWEIEKV
jgi:hypothetical protein